MLSVVLSFLFEKKVGKETFVRGNISLLSTKDCFGSSSVFSLL